jgi:hypothetical protein
MNYATACCSPVGLRFRSYGVDACMPPQRTCAYACINSLDGTMHERTAPQVGEDQKQALGERSHKRSRAMDRLSSMLKQSMVNMEASDYFILWATLLHFASSPRCPKGHSPTDGLEQAGSLAIYVI